MLSAHISSRILSVFMPSYPHGKTHQEGNEADWGGRKNEEYFPYFLSTGDNGQSQWTNPKLLQYKRQWSSSAQILVCLCDWAADIKHYWIFPKTWTARFWNLIQLMKAALEIGGGSASNVSNLWAEMNLVLSGHRSISMAIRENGLELKSKHQRGSQSLTESTTLKYIS